MVAHRVGGYGRRARSRPACPRAALGSYVAIVLLGCGYACLAIGLLLVGAQRQRDLERALLSGDHVPLRFRTVGVFTGGGVALAVMTVVLVVAQT